MYAAYRGWFDGVIKFMQIQECGAKKLKMISVISKPIAVMDANSLMKLLLISYENAPEKISPGYL